MQFRVKTIRGQIATASIPDSVLESAGITLGVSELGPLVRQLARKYEGVSLSERVARDILAMSKA